MLVSWILIPVILRQYISFLYLFLLILIQLSLFCLGILSLFFMIGAFLFSCILFPLLFFLSLFRNSFRFPLTYLTIWFAARIQINCFVTMFYLLLFFYFLFIVRSIEQTGCNLPKRVKYLRDFWILFLNYSLFTFNIPSISTLIYHPNIFF